MITGDPTMEDPDDFDYLMRSSSNSVMAESDSPQKNGIRAASPSNIMNPFEIPGMPGDQDAWFYLFEIKLLLSVYFQLIIKCVCSEVVRLNDNLVIAKFNR